MVLREGVEWEGIGGRALGWDWGRWDGERGGEGLAEVREVFEVGGFGDFEGGVDLAVGVAFGDHAAD